MRLRSEKKIIKDKKFRSTQKKDKKIPGEWYRVAICFSNSPHGNPVKSSF